MKTPDAYEYIFLEDQGMCVANQGSVQFWVKATNDVHITLADVKENAETLEIAIGGWGDSKSVLRFARGGENINEAEGSWLSAEEYRPFWVSWTGGKVLVGTGTEIGQNTFLGVKSEQAINYFGVATAWGSTGDWAFGYGQYITLLIKC